MKKNLPVIQGRLSVLYSKRLPTHVVTNTHLLYGYQARLQKMLQSSKTSPWGRLACTSVICWEKGTRGSGAMWVANWRINSAPDQVSTPSWFSSEYEGAIEIRSQSKLWHFLLFYGHLLFPHSNADGSPTYWMSNGHTMDFLPKVTWSQLGPWIQQTQFSEYYKTNFHAFTLQEINKFYTVIYIQMK